MLLVRLLVKFEYIVKEKEQWATNTNPTQYELSLFSEGSYEEIELLKEYISNFELRKGQ